ncbi:LptE family protein [Winogradskyella bathintestinalis]|uniref:LptE family protein n=1 Tax=Winogradskyella bathintestinalis TaxID=3035208 RepID=A0ABT7ZV31_9FLAO|nr:LptE family protein [Winogradskyella bathintestinalis]MDN3492855.1 LptE family protein [Winogradskyella bathintestinalis]
MKNLKYILVAFICVFSFGCKVNYSFTGITETPETFQVNFFQNNADLVEPGLDRLFTNALQDRIVNQTSAQLVTTGGEVIYEGEIVEYRISPMTATAEIKAAQNRLTISVNVRYINTKDPEKDMEQRFSFFSDYPANAQLNGSIKDIAFDEILERLTQDILNATLADW